MKRNITNLLLAALLVSAAYASFCGSHPKKGINNSLPFWSGEPRFVRQIENAILYEIGSNELNNTMKILHLYGTMEEMGYAQGKILGEELVTFFNLVWNYIVSQFEDGIPKVVPRSIARTIGEFGAEMGLELTYLLTAKYTTKAYYQEMWNMTLGMGDTDLFYKARNIHMIGELTKGHCSMFGAWGEATKNNETIQLRSLDWDMDGPFKQYPAIIVYHPSDPSIGNTFANIGFTGWLGMLSGVNEHKLAISEIGVFFSDESFGRESRIGNPFTFMMRDTIQFDKTLEDSIQRFKTDRRTCDLILGVGDGKPEFATFRGFQMSHTVANVIDDQNLIPRADWHPRINNTVYFGMDWNCPNWDIRLAELLTSNYGQIDAEIAVRNITGGLTSGNLQVVVYDLTNDFIYVSYGSDNNNYVQEAWEKSFVKVDLKKLWNEPKPIV